jgi:hypothetical protein
LLQDEKGKRAEKIDFGEKSAFGWRKARASLVESPRNFYGSSNP